MRLPPALQAALSDQYQIEREIARGGMATVYAARDLRHDRQVAIKVLHTDQGASGERFQREIQLIARLRHPHIVPLYDSGRSGELCWYAMPLLEGRTLRDRLREPTPLSPAEITRITTEVADALEYAHGHGVVHRDIKPENILLEGEHATVADFGIAQPATLDTGEKLTGTGIIVGTPTYMSPEQVTGARDLDSRSDLYSLGCVVYEMLTGRPPFEGTPARPVHVFHLTEPAPLARSRRAELPDGVDVAVQRALAKDPGERFSSTREFAAALALGFSPSGANLLSGASAAAQAKNRRRMALVAGTTALLVALLWFTARQFAWAPFASGRSGGRRAAAAAATDRVSLAILPFANLSDDRENAYFSDGVAEELIGAFSRMTRLRVAPRTSSFALRDRGLSLPAIAESLQVGNVMEGSIRRAGKQIKIDVRVVRAANDSLIFSESFTREMSDVLTVQSEIANAIASRLLVSLVPAERAAIAPRATENGEAHLRYLKGRFQWYQRTTPALMQAVTYYREALAIDPNYARAHAGLADSYSLLPWTGGMRSLEAFPLARQAATKALALDSTLSDAHVSLGIVKTFMDWDFKGAGLEFEKAMQLDSTNAQAWLFNSWSLTPQHRIEAALASVQHARALDPLALMINARVGMVQGYLHRGDEKEAAERRTLGIDSTFPVAKLQLALSLALNGRIQEALTIVPSAHGALGSYEAGIPGFVYALAGRRADALREIAELEKKPGAALDGIAAIYAGLGDKDNAIRTLERAYREHAFTIVFINVVEMFDSLRGDPRFDRIVAQIGLTAQPARKP